MRSPIALVLLLATLAAAPASAQMLANQSPPQHRLVHKNTFALRYNPLGLLYDGRFSYRFRLYESESKAMRDNFLGIGIAPTASPAFIRIGPFVEFNPLTILGFWAAVQYVQYYGTFDLFQSFPSAASDYSDTVLGARGDLPAGDPLRNFGTGGWEASMGVNFQMKVGPVVVRDFVKGVRPDMQLRAGDRVFYDQFYDVMAPNQGWYLTNDLDVVWQSPDNLLIAGARYTFTTAFFDPTKHYAPGDTAIDAAMHRVGPFLGYTFFQRDGQRFNTPTVFLLVQWWLKHRWRTGVDVTQALPLIGLGFQMTGDFLPLK